MCYTIDSESVLLNYFSKSSSSEISYKDLRILRKTIEASFDDSVYVDIRYSSLRDAVFMHNEVFDMELTKISIRNSEAKALTIKFADEINLDLPERIRALFLDLISEEKSHSLEESLSL
jgi:hypothetical protein